jgi:hypothetical protein
MDTRNKERLGTVIDRKLAGLARAAPQSPAWHEAWSQLGPGSTGEERLRVCLAIRDSGSLPDAAGYFLVCWKAEDLAADAVGKLRDPLPIVNRYEVRRTSDRLFAELLERHGEGRIASLFHTDPEGHARRREAGRQFFFGPEETEGPWDAGRLAALVRAVADCITASTPVAALEYWHRRDWDSFEVHVRPASGGQSGWAIDVEKLRAAFEDVEEVGWYAVPGIPSYCWIAGTFLDREVFLRVLADASQTTEPGESYTVWKRGEAAGSP